MMKLDFMWEILIILISLLIGFAFIWLCHWRLKNKATDISDLHSYTQEKENNQNIEITKNHKNIEKH